MKIETESRLAGAGWRLPMILTMVVALLGASAPEAVARDTGRFEFAPVVYTSPSYGFTLSYDPQEWQIVNGDPDRSDAYDTVTFGTGISTATIVGDPDYGSTNDVSEQALSDCTVDYAALVGQRSGVKDAETRSYVMDSPDTTGIAVAYTVDDEAWTEVVLCRSMPDGLTVVMIHDSPATHSRFESTLFESLTGTLSA